LQRSWQAAKFNALKLAECKKIAAEFKLILRENFAAKNGFKK